MKRSRFSEEQIIGILKEHEAGVSVADLCRKQRRLDLVKATSAVPDDLIRESTMDVLGSHPSRILRGLCARVTSLPVSRLGRKIVNNHPKGYRDPAHDELYRSPGIDRRVHKDYYSPSIEGYFRIPSVWIETKPDPEPMVFDASVHHAVVHMQTLSCGIEAQVLRDGHFLFDFSKWCEAPQVWIPGYTKPEGDGGYEIPQATSRAEEKAEDYAVIRARVMNVHQACLTTAETMVRRRSAAMGLPVTAWSTVKTWSFNSPVGYSRDIENPQGLARNVLNNIYGTSHPHPLPRRVLEIDVVQCSLNLLDQILSSSESHLFNLIETFYIAACRCREKRFGEAVTLGWTVCEQLVTIMWRRILDERRAITPAQVDKDRYKKLTGMDYTASVKLEMLEMWGKLDHDLFRRLDIARNARNRWAHRLLVPQESQAQICMRAIKEMLAKVHGIDLHLQSSGPGGVPMKTAYAVEQLRQRDSTT